jgi:hypothetical protein
MLKAYAVYGTLLLAALTWTQLTGWSPSDVTQAKGIPKSVRDNPGSYRSTYGGWRSSTGAK